MLNISRLFRIRSTFVALVLLLSTTAVADHTYVELHAVRIYFDGTEEQVEVLFSTDADFESFRLINPADEDVGIIAVTGGGENQVFTRSRDDFFPFIHLNEQLRLRPIFAPVVDSEPVLPTGEIVLHSVTVVGPNVEIVYSKGYSECAFLIDESGSLLSIFSGTICEPGNMVTISVNKADTFHPFSVGDEVRLETFTRQDLTTNSVIVGGAEPVLACALSEGPLKLQDRASITSTAIYAEGNIELRHGAHVTGTLQGAANANLFNNAKVTGDLQLIGTKSGSGIVTGTTQESFPVPFQSLTTENVADGGPDHTVNHDGLLILAPGSYGNVLVQDRGKLRLNGSGTYRFSSLKFNSDSKLQVDTSQGEFDIQIQSQFETNDRFKVLTPSGGAADGSKIFFYTNDNAIALGFDTVLRGSLTAPNAHLNFKDRAAVHGCVRAQQITMGLDAVISEN